LNFFVTFMAEESKSNHTINQKSLYWRSYFHHDHLAIKLDYSLRACLFHAPRFYHMHPYMTEIMPENVHIFLFLL
jgi:hypothetical protein